MEAKESIPELCPTGELVRCFLIRSLVALGALTAIAVLDLAPRAQAGYLSVATPTTTASFESDAIDSSSPSPLVHRLNWLHNLPYATPTQSGGMTSAGTSGPTTDGPPNGLTTPTDLKTDGLAVHYREPSSRLDLSRFIDTFLDPPRGF